MAETHLRYHFDSSAHFRQGSRVKATRFMTLLQASFCCWFQVADTALCPDGKKVHERCTMANDTARCEN